MSYSIAIGDAGFVNTIADALLTPWRILNNGIKYRIIREEGRFTDVFRCGDTATRVQKNVQKFFSALAFLMIIPIPLGLLLKKIALLQNSDLTKGYQRIEELLRGTIHLNNFFESPFFQQILKEVNNSLYTTSIVTKCVRYLSLARTPEETELIVEAMQKIDFSKRKDDHENMMELLKMVALIKGMQEIPSGDKEFRELAVELISRLDVVFHGTNPNAADGISRFGFNRDRRNYDNSEVERIIAISNRVLAKTWFKQMYPKISPWFNYYSNQPKRVIYVATRLTTAMDYASRSPEWFSEFLNNFTGSHNCDYENCVERVKRVCAEWQKRKAPEVENLTLEEQREIIAFTEKHAKLFANDHRLTVLSIKGKFLLTREMMKKTPRNYSECLDTYSEYAKIFAKKPVSSTREVIVDGLCKILDMLDTHFINEGIEDRDFLPSEITILKIPKTH